MAGVPENDVPGGVEDPVYGQGELDGPEIRPQMATRRGHRVDDEAPDLFAQFIEFLAGEALDVGGGLDAGQDHGARPRLLPGPPAAPRVGVKRVTTATPNEATARTWRPWAGPKV